MTSERRQEVNRILFKFEPDPFRLGSAGIMSSYIDLNALARLETKLPSHRWEIGMVGPPNGGRVGLSLTVFGEHWFDGAQRNLGLSEWECSAYGDTEAEARADAIAQYLASRWVD